MLERLWMGGGNLVSWEEKNRVNRGGITVWVVKWDHLVNFWWTGDVVVKKGDVGFIKY